jgi:hypothetical protein
MGCKLESIKHGSEINKLGSLRLGVTAPLQRFCVCLHSRRQLPFEILISDRIILRCTSPQPKSALLKDESN